ncbi:MAG: hypothetical protein KGO53_07915 [Alphaproteobacteria bacterium]|nr:hypothetical protein [Alphaproteobacteria bacterium]
MVWNADLIISAAVFLAGLGLAGWMYWLEKHPPGRLQPRLFPTTLVLLLGLLMVLGGGIHLLAWAGYLPPKHP